MPPTLSLVHTMASEVHEFGRFVFTDAITSLVFGVPSLIDYDTSTPASMIKMENFIGCVHPVEWVHGAPLPLMILIVKINLWRARNSPFSAASEEEWKPLEEEAWAWNAQVLSPSPNDEPHRIVARMAVQEGWRHAALIYLYMVRLPAFVCTRTETDLGNVRSRE
jgi:hypothetical protein